ncbi:hypothetical protein J4447_03360 [Candidatus Pacearchaeota archaeon]|nr:hypothetical protein [Candidatus Pacearchaeota archaeon]
MVNIDTLFKKKRISRINELELERYTNFFENSWRENIRHSRKDIEEFPRWSIISGYYAMHDITKLLLARKFRIKIDFKIHKTTIEVLEQVIKNRWFAVQLEKGYKEFLNLASDLEEAKNERTKMQYYTDTAFMREEYKKKAREFFSAVVNYLEKIRELIK